jgi:acetyltransferase-like isoleucine patch superfamily enzyme
MLDSVIRRVRSLYLQWLGLKLTGKCWIRSVDIPRNHADIQLGTGVALDQHVVLLSTGKKRKTRISIGDRTYLNRGTMIDACESISIGPDCMFGPYCYVTDSNHGIVAGKLVREQLMHSEPTVIECGVWVGAHATILKGVTVSEGAIIGAGSVVTRDVPENTIVVGVPAKAIGERPSQKK